MTTAEIDIVAAERAAIHEAHDVLTDRSKQPIETVPWITLPNGMQAADLPTHFATVTYPREVFADIETRNKAAEIGQNGRHWRVSVVIKHLEDLTFTTYGEAFLNIDFADFGWHPILKRLFVEAKLAGYVAGERGIAVAAAH